MTENDVPPTARPMLALAALSASAGVIHAAMTPSHMDAVDDPLAQVLGQADAGEAGVEEIVWAKIPGSRNCL